MDVFCNTKHKDCNICTNEEEEWQIEQSVKEILGKEKFNNMKSMVQIYGREETGI